MKTVTNKGGGTVSVMKAPSVTASLLVMTIALWSGTVANRSRYCSMHLPRALIAICGVTKRGGSLLNVDSTHAFLRSAGYYGRSSSDGVKRAVQAYRRLYTDTRKRGLAPIHVMADICCRRGCSLDDLLETCQ